MSRLNLEIRNWRRIGILFLVSLFAASRPVFPANDTSQALPAVQASEVAAEDGALRRDPFWPIGYAPPSMPGKTSDPAQSIDSARDKKTAFPAANLSGMLRIGGVVRKGNKFYATINGFTFQAGEVVSVVADGEVYQFIVEEIDFNKVRFRPFRR